MSYEIARKAAAYWRLNRKKITLIADRENIIFRATGVSGSYALRLHRPGYRNETELWSELQWMKAMAQGGLNVPCPLKSSDGSLIMDIDGVLVDVLHWLPGTPLGIAAEMHDVNDRAGFCQKLGIEIAKMHDLCDAWIPPDGFSRPRWDRPGLLGETPLWDRFWEHPHLSSSDQSLLVDVRQTADTTLAACEADQDFGLIHADLVSENVLINGTNLSFIDFDDGGWGFRDFELATFLMRYLDVPDYVDLRAALLEGYAAHRKVDEDILDLFILLRATTYVGWIITRLNEPRKAQRSKEALERALSLAQRYARNL